MHIKIIIYFSGDVSMDWSDRSLGSKEEKRGPPEDTAAKSRANKTYSSDRMQEFIIKVRNSLRKNFKFGVL